MYRKNEQMIKEKMEELGWIEETHLILGKKEIRYHKSGFELPLDDAISLLMANVGKVNKNDI